MKTSPRTALAATLGLDTTELNDYRYQAGRHARALYAIDDIYACAGLKQPRLSAPFDGLEWREHPDQFWAAQAGTKIWIAKHP